MGFRFRKSFKLGKNSKINVSKSGMSFSVKDPLGSTNFNKKGMRRTFSLKGTGLSYSENYKYPQIKKKPVIIIIILIILTIGCCCGCGSCTSSSGSTTAGSQ